MIPSREKAEQLLQEGLQKNPGPWGDHSKTAAHCAEKIAAACGDLDPEKRMCWDFCMTSGGHLA